jgi:acetyl/propionyl-CoA carboxylase alpha subunit
MKRLKLEIDGVTHEAWTQKLGSVLWIHLEGETFTYEPEKKIRRKGAAAATSDSGSVVAPMPGKITKISVGLNQSVEPGQTLLVLEAMKMEYTLKAPAAGLVTVINGQVGDQVKLGQVLVQVKASMESQSHDK